MGRPDSLRAATDALRHATRRRHDRQGGDLDRVRFIASLVGGLEFNCLSSPENFEVAKSNLRFKLRGFLIGDANGKFETLPAQAET